MARSCRACHVDVDMPPFELHWLFVIGESK
jgi:hypothetical protein